MRGDISQDSRKDPETLEREIDATRAELEDTLGALEQRLSPHRLFDLALGQFREHGGEFAGNLGSSLKDNPVPLLLTSVGIAWMMANDRRQHDGDGASGASANGGGRARQLGERARGAGGALKQRGAAMRRGADGSRAAVSRSADQVRSRAGSARQAAGERAGSARQAASERAGQARAGFDRMLREQPLVLGAIGIAAGAVIGAALPPTEEEDSLMGPARDRVKDRAKAKGKEAYSRARERTEETAERAKQQMESGGAQGGDGDGGSQQQPAAQQAGSSQPSSSSSTPRA